MRFIVIIFFLGLANLSHAADRTALILGGADNPFLPWDFKKSADQFSEKLATRQYELHYSFDKLSTPGFSKESAEAEISKLTESIRSKKPGDQVMVIINSHGADRSHGGTHKIITSSGELFDVAALQSVQKIAKERGIQLAILDLSCYSGQTLQLAKDNPSTCVITASSAEMVADARFGNLLFDEMKPNRSLEDAFLAARSKTEYGFPEISTQEGQRAYDLLKVVHKVATVYIQDLPIIHDEECGIHRNSIINQVRALTKVLATSTGLSESDIANLQYEMNTYEAYRPSISEDAKFFKSKIQVGSEQVAVEGLVNLEAKDYMTSYYHEVIEATNTGTLPQTPVHPYSHRSKEYRDIRDKLYATNENFRRLAQFEAGGFNPQRFVKLWSFAFRVSNAEREVYDKIYKQRTNQTPHPCRDFKF